MTARLRVLCTYRFPGPALDRLFAAHDVRLEEDWAALPAAEAGYCRGVEVLATWAGSGGIGDAELAGFPALRFISYYGLGLDRIDLDAVARRGVGLAVSRGVVEGSTAEIAFALLLASARRVAEGDALLREGRWPNGALSTDLLGTSVSGKTIGIVGLGAIGHEAARMARAFRMEVLYTQRHRAAPDVEAELQARYVSLPDLLRAADFVSLHCPLTPETRHLIDREALALMKPTAHLVNTARGAVVDEEALVEALATRTIAGAGLDVFEHEPEPHPRLRGLRNVVMVPHVGGATFEAREGMTDAMVQRIEELACGEEPAHLVPPVRTLR